MYNYMYGVHAFVHTHLKRVLVLRASPFKAYLDPKWLISAMCYAFKKCLESLVVYGKWVTTLRTQKGTGCFWVLWCQSFWTSVIIRLMVWEQPQLWKSGLNGMLLAEAFKKDPAASEHGVRSLNCSSLCSCCVESLLSWYVSPGSVTCISDNLLTEEMGFSEAPADGWRGCYRWNRKNGIACCAWLFKSSLVIIVLCSFTLVNG